MADGEDGEGRGEAVSTNVFSKLGSTYGKAMTLTTPEQIPPRSHPPTAGGGPPFPSCPLPIGRPPKQQGGKLAKAHSQRGEGEAQAGDRWGEERGAALARSSVARVE